MCDVYLLLSSIYMKMQRVYDMVGGNNEYKNKLHIRQLT